MSISVFLIITGILSVLFVIGVLHEEELVAFEDKAGRAIKSFFAQRGRKSDGECISDGTDTQSKRYAYSDFSDNVAA